jgi:hypothetical protein
LHWVAEWVAVFPSKGSASAEFGAAAKEVACIVDALNAGTDDSEGITYSDASYTALYFPTVGDDSRAFRIKATQTSPNGGTVTRYSDVIYVRTDRVIVLLGANGYSEPFVVNPSDVDQVKRILSAAIARVHQGLANH